MTIQIVKDSQEQVAWEREPSEYAEGVTLTHLKPWHKNRTRIVEYKGTASALIKAGLCREDQLPGQPSTGVNSITFAPDGTRKRAGGSPVQAGTMHIHRSGLSFKCHVHVEINSDERIYLKNEYEKEAQEYERAQKQRKQERESLAAADAQNYKSYYELQVAYFEECSDELIDRLFQSSRSMFLDEERAMNYVKAQRRKAIAESDGVVIRPKIWQNA
jgi:hypothetical protein